ncbi:MFS transporter [bacterium]|nr:MFS transporter [bacterium]
MQDSAPLSAQAPPETRPQAVRLLSSGQLIRISLLWYGLQFFWASQQQIVLPHRVEDFVSADQKGFYYMLIKSAGAFMVVLTQFTVGFLSDHTHSRLGPRRPFIITGISGGLLAILFFMFAPGYWWLFAAYMLIEIFINAASIPFQALLPDLVPEKQHDRAGALMGLGNLGGNFLGLLVIIAMPFLFGEGKPMGPETLLLGGNVYDAGNILFLLPLYILALTICTLIVVFSVNETAWAQHERERISGPVFRFSLLPGTLVEFARTGRTAVGSIVRHYLSLDFRTNADFKWLAISRFVIHLGYCTFQAFVAYFAAACLDREGWLLSLGLTPSKSLLKVVLPAMLLFFLLGGLAGNLLSVPVSARFGRLRTIAGSLVCAILLFIPLIFTHNVWVAVGMGLFIGMSWGAFIASDWAFATTLMPKQQSGSYMGIWDFTTLMPQVLAPMIGGPLRDWIYGLQARRLAPGLDPAALPEALMRACEAPAYQIIFGTIIIWFALGIWLLRFVRSGRLPA